MTLSAAGGDYLEALLSLTETKQPVYAVDLARRLRYFEELLCEAGLPADCARTEAYRVRHAVSPAAYAQLRAAKDRKKSAQSKNFEKTVDKA